VPAPFEDIDPVFVHRHWTTEVNSTRRTDHGARYRVTWGPFVGARLAQENGVRGAAAFVGPGLFTAYQAKQFLHSPGGLMFARGSLPQISAAQITSSQKNKFLPAGLTEGTTWVGMSGGPIIICELLDQQQPNYRTRLCMEKVNRWAYEIAVTPSMRFRNACLLPADKFTLFSVTFTRHEQFADRLSPVLSGWHNKTFVATSAADVVRFHGLSMSSVVTAAEQALLGEVAAIAAGLKVAQQETHTLITEDIRAIRRLRTSKAVVLPSDVPMHIICGSKDVIHSWAIPGLGIKIDCIPGFSSHRRLILRWRGTYWGQCMEVCGRYHH
jgi:heme/copper-type cytochrome/quinol oxidase subunit 2